MPCYRKFVSIQSLYMWHGQMMVELYLTLIAEHKLRKVHAIVLAGCFLEGSGPDGAMALKWPCF